MGRKRKAKNCVKGCRTVGFTDIVVFGLTEKPHMKPRKHDYHVASCQGLPPPVLTQDPIDEKRSASPIVKPDVLCA